MARVNVYLPDELAAQARDAGLNVSGLTQEAIRQALDARRTDVWLDRVSRSRRSQLDLETIKQAVQAAKDEMESGTE